MRRWRKRGPGRADPEPSELVARAINDLLPRIPPPSADLQERILQSVHRSCEARRNRPSHRLRMAVRLALVALQRSPVALRAVAAAVATLLLVTVLTLGAARDPGTAIASGVLTPGCPAGREVRANSGASDDGRSGRRVLQVAGTWVGQEQENFEKVLELFERTTDVEVRYAYQTHDIAKSLRKRVEGGCAPDVALLPQPGLLQEFARRGWLERLDHRTDARVRRNYAAPWRQLAKVRRTSYGVWLKAANKSAFWFNLDLFETANVKPPSTWQELQQVAAQLRGAGIAPFAVAGASASAWTLTDWFENVYLRTAGTAKYDALARGEIKWTDETVRKALVKLSQILGRSAWLAGGRSGAARTEYVESVRQVLSAKPEAAMVFEGDFVAGLRETERAETARRTGTFPFPAIDQAPDAVVAGGDVAVQFKTKNASAAREFMHFLAGPTAAAPWAAAGGFISPNKKLAPRVYNDPITQGLARPLHTETILFDLSDLQPPAFGAESGQGMWRIFEDYLMKGPASIPMTMQRLQRASDAARRCERLNEGEC